MALGQCNTSHTSSLNVNLHMKTFVQPGVLCNKNIIENGRKICIHIQLGFNALNVEF